MDFLKVLWGEKALTFDEFMQAVNAHNGDEANKEKQIKIGNLGSGEYVRKGKYDALNDTLSGKQAELDSANNLIAELKEGINGNDELQNKISTYETVTIPSLEKQLQEAKLNAAVKVALLEEKALDVPYLTYKLNEKLRAEGKVLELDENESIKGWGDILSGLKTQLPTQFEGSATQRQIEIAPLPKSDQSSGRMTKAEFLRKSYAERAAFANDNPDVYKQIMNH